MDGVQGLVVWGPLSSDKVCVCIFLKKSTDGGGEAERGVGDNVKRAAGRGREECRREIGTAPSTTYAHPPPS